MKYFISGILTAVLLAAADPSAAEGILDQVGWRDPSRRDPTVLLLVVAALTAVFILAYRAYLDTRQKIEKQNKAAAERQASQKEFSRRRRAAGLNEEEVAVLTAMVANNRIAKPHTVFASVVVFEQCVDREIRRLARKRMSASQQQAQGAVIMRLREKLGFADLPATVRLPSTRNMVLGQTGSIYGRSSRVPDRLVLMIRRAEVTEIGWRTFILGYDAGREENCNFLPGEKVRFSFSRSGDARYRATLTVAAGSGSGRIELYHCSELRRQQSREDFRLDAEVPVTFRILKRSGMGEAANAPAVGEVFTAKTCNVSGGGLSMVSDQLLAAGDLLTVDFEVLENRFTVSRAEVVCAQPQEDPGSSFKFLVRFTEIERTVQEQLVKQVFEMARRKGLGEAFTEEEEEADDLDDGIYIVN